MSVFNHGLHKLLEDSVHVGGLPWPDSLQKTNMASIRSKNQSNIRVLLCSFYWDSLMKNGGWSGGRVIREGKEREKYILTVVVRKSVHLYHFCSF